MGNPDPSKITTAGHLWGAVFMAEAVEFRLSHLRTALFNAEEAARLIGRPHEDLRALGDEVDAISELLEEKVQQILRQLAQEETNTLG